MLIPRAGQLRYVGERYALSGLRWQKIEIQARESQSSAVSNWQLKALAWGRWWSVWRQPIASAALFSDVSNGRVHEGEKSSRTNDLKRKKREWTDGIWMQPGLSYEQTQQLWDPGTALV